MYLNAYVPQLTSEAGIAAFCRGYLGHRFASTKQAVAMTETFVKSIRAFIESEGVELVHFKKGQRKDDVLQAKLRRFHKQEGVIFVGVAQEKVRVPRTTRKRLESGGTVPWIIYSTAMVNVYYFYCRDRDFGPFFLKFCSYFPYSAKLCLNGHEYLKCQLTQRGIGFEAMDNGLLSCTDIQAAQHDVLAFPLGPKAVVAGNGTGLPDQLGMRLSIGRVVCRLGPGPSKARRRALYRRGRNPLGPRPAGRQLPDRDLSDRSSLPAFAVGRAAADSTDLAPRVGRVGTGGGQGTAFCLQRHVGTVSACHRRAGRPG